MSSKQKVIDQLTEQLNTSKKQAEEIETIFIKIV